MDLDEKRTGKSGYRLKVDLGLLGDLVEKVEVDGLVAEAHFVLLLHTFRKYPARTFGHAGTNLGRAAGRDRRISTGRWT